MAEKQILKYAAKRWPMAHTLLDVHRAGLSYIITGPISLPEIVYDNGRWYDGLTNHPITLDIAFKIWHLDICLDQIERNISKLTRRVKYTANNMFPLLAPYFNVELVSRDRSTGVAEYLCVRDKCVYGQFDTINGIRSSEYYRLEKLVKMLNTI